MIEYIHHVSGLLQGDFQVLAAEFQLDGFVTEISPLSKRQKKQLTAEQFEADAKTLKSLCTMLQQNLTK